MKTYLGYHELDVTGGPVGMELAACVALGNQLSGVGILCVVA